MIHSKNTPFASGSTMTTSRFPLRPLAACLLLALAGTPGSTLQASAADGQSPPRPRGALLVSSCADDGSSGTLRSVVAGAATGDTIDLTQLDCSTITLSSGQIEIDVNDLTLTGPGRDALAIDGNNAGRVLFHSGTGTLTLSGLTLTHGLADAAIDTNPPNVGMRGGCVFSNAGGSLAISDATITECRAVNATGAGNGVIGGGIYARHPVTLTRTTVSNNTADGTAPAGGSVPAVGGGVFTSLGTITLTESIVSGNRAITGGAGTSSQYVGIGGGMYASLSAMTITDSVIDNNFAGCDTTVTSCFGATAGGFGLDGYNKVLTLSSSIVSNNTVSASGKVRGGGAVALAGGAQHRITDTQISGNQALSTSAQGYGGGTYLLGGYPTVSTSTVSGNTADVGGGVFMYYGRLTVANSTLSGNTAGNAGAIYNAHASGYYGGNGPLTVRNSTITANIATAAAATGGVAGGIVDTQAQFPSTFQSSIVAGNSAPNADPGKADVVAFQGSITGANNLIVAAAGLTLPTDTISADPLLGPLQDNGGPTPTHALLFGSPALDTGNNSSNLDFDQRGDGYARVIGLAADIGAFENQQAFVPPIVIKTFAPGTIGRNAASTLTITLTNGDDIAGTLTADLVDALPGPVVVADPANATTTCPGGTVNAEPGAGSVTLGSGAGFPAAGSCTITVSVTSNTEGTYTNTIPAGALQTDLGSSIDAATADLTVVNTPPVAGDDAYATAENMALTVDAAGVLANDTDADGDVLAALLAAGPAHGTLTLNPDGSFVYAPALDFSGSDSFVYLASDGQASAAATVTITVKQGTDETIFADSFESP